MFTQYTNKFVCSLDCVPVGNSAIRRGALDNITRCHIALQHYSQALEAVKQVVSSMDQTSSK